MSLRHHIQFPPAHGHDLSQAEAYFHVIENGKPTKLRFHDYDAIYTRPGLYEQLFYDRLKCNSPDKVWKTLSVSASPDVFASIYPARTNPLKATSIS